MIPWNKSSKDTLQIGRIGKKQEQVKFPLIDFILTNRIKLKFAVKLKFSVHITDTDNTCTYLFIADWSRDDSYNLRIRKINLIY